MTLPRKRDRAATRAALLAAARARFAASGFDGTSVRDIAADAGVDPTLIFRYFGSKQELFDEAVNATGEPWTEDGDADELPARLLRSAVAHDWPESAGEHPLIALLRSANREESRDRLHEQVCEHYIGNLTGLVDGPDRELRAELLSALLLGISVSRSIVRTSALVEADTETIEPYFEQVADVLLGRSSGDR
ncbi:TetR/AcrR family transcriptional regulator [Saccharopolyspora erythraea]|uniref:TetR/AcrR family transcriptional regulator n=1 Tax=Saccharopolyspora erythraea TaxID=1836 RepID=UPI001BAAFB36|nr:TetR family transcriptional regulator [Saccharopolyspora erythraea]QUH03168.1 TetR/AcrR family transcriptional regulator [Saccharopolyspora erythraea]